MPGGRRRTAASAPAEEVSHGPDSRFDLRLRAPRSARAAQRKILLDSRRDARARGAPFGGGLRDPVDARRESGEMASRAHDVVLRDFRPGSAPAGLPRFRAGVPGPVQLLLQQCRRSLPAAAAGAAVAPWTRS